MADPGATNKERPNGLRGKSSVQPLPASTVFAEEDGQKEESISSSSPFCSAETVEAARCRLK